MKEAIIGAKGYVGAAMKNLFKDAILYDITDDVWASKEAVNKCDLGIICVNTPQSEDGSADLSQVHEVLSWLETPLILIKSTMPPGTTEKLKEKYGKRIIFSPEYIGETIAHNMLDLVNRDFWIFGGERKDTMEVVEFWKSHVKTTARFYQTDSKTAEIVKYMENCFFATKVMFCNEFYEICKSFGKDYNEVRELWLADSTRINRNHTQIYEDNRGFGGKCLPKDLAAIVKASTDNGYIPDLLREVEKSNKRFKGDNQNQSESYKTKIGSQK